MKTRIALLVAAALALAPAWPDLRRPAVRTGSGEAHLAGQLIIQLNQSQRGRICLSSEGGVARFGIPALDELNRRWGVEDISCLVRSPHPNQAQLRHGCDLQFLIQFEEDQSIAPVAAEYQARPEVASVCPNALMPLDSFPNDPLFSQQWHLDAIDAPYAWTYVRGDSTVSIALLDDGIDYRHPDLEANLRVNPLEDINHNGRFDPEPAPAGDIDGIDQDGNGYADDVIGYDFNAGDPDPMPDSGDVHGTHCAGTANAVTDNGIGVSAPPWNVSTVATRCGGGGFISVYAAISALNYAISEGVWAVSMDFGSTGQNQALAAACQAAWDAGLVLFAPAGGDGVRAIRYPAGNEGVEAVACTGRDGGRSSWTNWGPWIDVCAPGETIMATLPRSAGMYGALDGTSIATPIAAAVAAWIKCVYPAATNSEALDILHECCEPIDDSLYRIGELGAGIVNMGNVVARQYNCNLTLAGWRFNDESGNNNGRPDPGETCAVVVTYANAPGFRDATDVRASIACSSREFIVVKDTAGFPDIAAGDSADCSADSFIVFMPDSAPPQVVTFSLVAVATPEPFHPDSDFEVRCGEPRLLIVDDDEGSDYEKYYTGACDSNSVLYDLYSVQVSGSPSADTLRHYPVVAWFCGNDSVNTLTATDQTNLTSYLTNGGNLFISGQNIAQDIATDGFLDEYLHAQLVDDSTGKLYVVGAAEDPVMDGDTAVLGGTGGANNARSTDAIRPVGGALGCGHYKDYPDTSVQAVIRYAGAYKLVFFSCPFEAIDHSVSRYVQRWTLLGRILLYFGERLPGLVGDPQSSIASRRWPFAIRPNPVTRQVVVSFTSPVTGNATLRFLTPDGRLAYQSRIAGPGSPVTLDLRPMPAGVYVVQLVTPTGVSAQKVTILR